MRKLAYALLLLGVSSGALMAEEVKPVTVVKQQLLTLPDKPQKPLVMNIMSDGAMVVELDERFEHRLVAVVNESGQVELICTDDHQLADALMAEPVDTILRLRGGRGRMDRKAERE